MAHVAVSVPANGVGIIALVVGSRRTTLPARCNDGTHIPRSTEVVIVEVRGRVAIVSPIGAPAHRDAHASRTSRLRMVAEAEADAKRLVGQAEADVKLAHAHAEAEVVRQRALEEAEGLQKGLEAEAEGMRKKAEAWKHYNSAALAELAIDRLPEIASAVAAPLSKAEKIVLIGDGGGSSGVERITRSLTEVLAQVPSVVEAVSGVDLGQLLNGLPTKSNDGAPPAA